MSRENTAAIYFNYTACAELIKELTATHYSQELNLNQATKKRNLNQSWEHKDLVDHYAGLIWLWLPRLSKHEAHGP
jgi:hypothetical protein